MSFSGDGERTPFWMRVACGQVTGSTVSILHLGHSPLSCTYFIAVSSQVVLLQFMISSVPLVPPILLSSPLQRMGSEQASVWLESLSGSTNWEVSKPRHRETMHLCWCELPFVHFPQKLLKATPRPTQKISPLLPCFVVFRIL